jgi:hypothetical protein
VRTVATPISNGYSEREVAREFGISRSFVWSLLDEVSRELLTGSASQTYVLETRNGSRFEFEGILIREKGGRSVYKLADGRIASYHRKTLRLEVL